MKHRFLKTIAVAFPLSIALVLGAKFATLAHMRSQLDFSLPAGKHVLVLGNSHGRDAVCDSLLTGWANRCADGEMYCGAYLLAERFLAQNRIDTLVVNLSSFDINPDESVNTSYLLFKSSRMAIANEELLADLAALNWRDLLTFYCLNDVYTLLQPVETGGYERWNHHGLAKELVDLDFRLARDGRVELPRTPIADFSMQTTYIKKIADLCNRHHVALVLLNYPKYERDKYFIQSKAWDVYTTLGDGFTIADYENFVFPDTSYYANTTHLNYLGAECFSQSIKRHGLHTLAPRRWRTTRK